MEERALTHCQSRVGASKLSFVAEGRYGQVDTPMAWGLGLVVVSGSTLGSLIGLLRDLGPVPWRWGGGIES